jgi:hypothetical protein
VTMIDAVSRVKIGVMPGKRFANRILMMFMLRTGVRGLQEFELLCS